MTGWIEIDGMRLRHLDVAPRSGTADGPPVLIIPGHTARIEGYLDLVDRLCDRRRVLVLDCPGSGESAKPVRRYDLRFYEDTLVAYLDALGIERAVPVGGSLGQPGAATRPPVSSSGSIAWCSGARARCGRPSEVWRRSPAPAAPTRSGGCCSAHGSASRAASVRPGFEHRQHLDETFGHR
ncbi:MAG: alpha/beta fold hydrolase [Acidimicrobiales bacterium]